MRPQEQEEEEEAHHGQEGDQEKALANQEELDLINHAEYDNCWLLSSIHLPTCYWLQLSAETAAQWQCQCQAQQPVTCEVTAYF